MWNCHEVFRSNEVPDLMYMVLWYRRLQQVNKQEEEDNTSIYCCLAGPTACQLVRVTFYYMWICMCVCACVCVSVYAYTCTYGQYLFNFFLPFLSIIFLLHFFTEHQFHGSPPNQSSGCLSIGDDTETALSFQIFIFLYIPV